MKKILGYVLAGICILYFASLLIMTPYYNWQYAKEHGFIKWLFFGEIVATLKSSVWPYYVFIAKDSLSTQHNPEGKIIEYTDNEYGFSFQFPSDWKMKNTSSKREFGEARVIMMSPKSTMLMVMVQKLEKPISKQAFDNNPNSNALVDSMINYTIESVYKKASQDIGATRIVVGEKIQTLSEIAVKFFISTVNYVKVEQGELPVMASGIHYFPFEKDYLIAFMMIGSHNLEVTDDNETIKRVFNSFHLVGEKPL
jgi:hypothetical protein